MRRTVALLLVAVVISGCAFFPPPHPDHAYYPSPSDPGTVKISQTLHRAAEAAGDDSERYSFALIQTSAITAFATEEATFYFSDGLARQPQRCIDAIVAQKVAHEVLGHAGQRRVLSLVMTAGFAILGLFMPGLGLADFIVNPLVVRAYSRDQELAADQRALEILKDMGHAAPRRALADALRAAAATNPPPSRHFEQRPLAIEPDLDARLLALEPLEPTSRPLLRRPITAAKLR
jgi:Zn-dependent protease with chaperone function